ncbi:MAG: ABC transporter ATP-binding protein [Bacilli bacterium]
MTEFEEELETKQYSLKDTKLLKGFLPYIKPYLKHFIFILLLDIVVDTLFTVEPVVVSRLLNNLQQFSDGLMTQSEVLNSVILLMSIDASMMIVASLGAYLVNMGLKKIGSYIIRDFRNDMFKHVYSLSLSQLRDLPIGSYVTRITNDTQNLSSFFSDVLPQLLRAILTLLIILVTTFVMEGLYGFIFLSFLPVVFLLSYFFRKKAKKYYRMEKKSISKMNSFLSESFQGVKVTKTYNREEKKNQEFEVCNDRIYHSFLKSQDLFAIFYPMMYLLQMVCIIIILAFAVPKVALGVMLVGDLNMLYSYSTQFFSPIQTITQLLNNLQSIISSGERTQAIMDMKPEITSGEDSVNVPAFKGKIEFRNVSFAYEKDNYVLKDVSFIIKPGETAAFVGATGAGKSTIISLISRTYEVNAGQVLIDDIDIRDYSLTCLRRNVGVMLQDVFLFSGTIEENISLGDEKLTSKEIEDGAKEVGADTFITRLPKSYQEKVTERGENFSAGQRQLISFARTLVYKPSLVLLDEATANIDTETENIIQKSLERMRSIGTMVIVAHRLSTIKNANVIFVVSHGSIIESGTHQELLKQHGTYYNLYRLQNMENDAKLIKE